MDVQMPDGTLLTGIPEGTTKAEIMARYQKSQGQPSVMDNYGAPVGQDVAKGVGSGLVTGLASILGAPGDLAKMVSSGLGEMAPGPSPLDTSSVGKAAETGLDALTTPGLVKLLRADYAPATVPGKYAKEITSGAAGFAPGGGGALGLVKRALAGAGLGGVSESANQLQDPIGGTSANAAITAALAGIGAKKPRIVSATQDLVKDVGETGLRDAAQNVDAAGRVLGSRPVLTQGINTPTGMTALTQDLIQQPGSGADVRRAIEAQGPLGRSKIDDLIAKLTGAATDQSGANRVLQAGDAAIQRPEQIRTDISKPYYQEAAKDTIPGSDMLDIVTALGDRRQDLHLPQTSDSGRTMTAMERKVAGTVQGFPNKEGQLLLGPDGKPLIRPTSALDLDTLRKEASAKAAAADKEGATGADIAKKLGQQTNAAVLKEATREASPALAAGQDLSGQATEQLVKPMQQSVLTTAFPAATRATGKGKWDSMLPVLEGKGSDITSDINMLSYKLQAQDPEAFPLLAKRWLETKKEAADTLSQGRENPNYFSNFVDSTAGPSGSNQRKNFSAIIAGVAQSSGRDPIQAVQGANDLMDALQVASRERAGLGRLNTQEVERAAGSNVVTGATRMMSLLRPFWSMGTAVERHVFNKTYEQVAQALTTPEGVDKLIEIANYGSPDRAAGVAKALVRGNALQQGEQ